MSDLTQEIPTVRHSFGYGALTLSGRPFQEHSPRMTQSDVGLLQPSVKDGVWAVPVSLATTPGIAFAFFSPAT